MKKVLAIILSFVICFVSCKKEDPGNPPTLPPKDSMEMTTSDFENKSDSDSSYWVYSAQNIVIWNTILTLNLAIPVVAFKEAHNHNPVYQSDSEEWLWSYNVTPAGVMHTVKLYGKDQGEQVIWRMELTKQGSFTDFIWYTGVSYKDEGEGSWSFKKNPNNPKDFIDVEWTKNESAVSEIKFTHVEQGINNTGGYIHYSVTASADLDASYTIFNANEDKYTFIEWSRDDKKGRVKDLNKYGDEDWRCWNDFLANTDCQ